MDVNDKQVDTCILLVLSAVVVGMPVTGYGCEFKQTDTCILLVWSAVVVGMPVINEAWM